MVIIGLNMFHGDASACIIKDGILLAAAEEERFTRIKHWAGVPINALNFCLETAKVTIKDVEHISINRNPNANKFAKLKFALGRIYRPSALIDRIRKLNKITSIESELSKIYKLNHLNAHVHYIEHHEAHLASAFFASPFDKAAVVSIDGFGDFASTAWGSGQENNLCIDNKILFPHSLGIFYQALTQYLGFINYGDEYKVMGLAPYGEPQYTEELKKLVLLKSNGEFRLNMKYFRHDKEKIELEWNNGSPKIATLFTNDLTNLLGPSRKPGDNIEKFHLDVARSTQQMYELALYNLLNSVHKKYSTDNLAIAGGCGMNSVANGKIYDNTPFKKVYIQAAAGDAGGAIGAAYATQNKLTQSKTTSQLIKGKNKLLEMRHAYWGPRYSNEEISKTLDLYSNEFISHNIEVSAFSEDSNIFDITAKAISEGKVIGWFSGRMEWGPRALGNRSILGDPRRADMKDILNQKIKRRESFRPFAPSILRECTADWFEIDEDVPFMAQVFQIKCEKRPLIPAVTHVDGSGRLQTVENESNPRYYSLIKAFYKITNIPILLNTSFNENEPVVCSPNEAILCFMRTKMDMLVMENYYLIRHQ